MNTVSIRGGDAEHTLNVLEQFHIVDRQETDSVALPELVEHSVEAQQEKAKTPKFGKKKKRKTSILSQKQSVAAAKYVEPESKPVPVPHIETISPPDNGPRGASITSSEFKRFKEVSADRYLDIVEYDLVRLLDAGLP